MRFLTDYKVGEPRHRRLQRERQALADLQPKRKPTRARSKPSGPILMDRGEDYKVATEHCLTLR